MQLACGKCSEDVQEGDRERERVSVCVYLKGAICSPADTEPEVSMSKAKGNIHQGSGNQASCTWQHHMGVSSQER